MTKRLSIAFAVFALAFGGAASADVGSRSVSRFRASDGGLATNAGTNLTTGPGSRKSITKKRDEKIAPIGRAAAPTKKAQSPFATAIDAISAAAKKARPRASGRVRVSFTVGRRGQVVDPLVISFDPKLDAELENILRQHKFDRKLAGLIYTKTVAVKADKKAAKRKHRRARRARRARTAKK